MPHATPTENRKTAAVLMLLAMAVVLVYANALHAPFTFDDDPNIFENPHIRISALSFEKIAGVVHSPSLRPFANLTFALNYYFHGYDVAGYHAVNIAIHILAGFLVFLVVRLTLGLMSHEKKDLIAALASLLWIANPVHTQSVTYIVQRMTSLSALFFLLALYLYIKARLRQKSQKPLVPLFFVLSGLSGVLSLMAKQTGAMLPVIVLFYEWYFFQDLDTAWIKKQGRWIGGTVLVIAVIAAIYLGASPVHKILSMYDKQTFTMGQRLLTEPRVVFLYLSLIFFPHPSRLNLDYDFPVSTSLIDPVTTALSIAGIIGLAAAAVVTARKYRLASFTIVWFLATLFIESSFLGLALVFEHRVYLPSVFVVAALAWAVVTYVRPQPLAAGVLCAVAVLWGVWTYQRNAIWADDVALWQDVVNKNPASSRTWGNLGLSFARKGDLEQALAHYRRALEIDPGNETVHNNLGMALVMLNRPQEAIAHFQQAVALAPSFAKAHANLGIRLFHAGRPDEAKQSLLQALDLDPSLAEALNILAVMALQAGDPARAVSLLEKALAHDPNHVEAGINMGLAYIKINRPEKGVPFLEHAAALDPAGEKVRLVLARALAMQGKTGEAEARLRQALDINPGSPEAWNSLGNLMAMRGKIDDAAACYEKALASDPAHATARQNLADMRLRKGDLNAGIRLLDELFQADPRNPALALKLAGAHEKAGDPAAALALYEKALALEPGCVACLNRLAGLLARRKDYAAAARRLEQALALAPGSPDILYNLACVFALGNDTGRALSYLQQAVESGYDKWEHIRSDRDLDSIRNTDAYQRLIKDRVNP